jgi:hypothetical protein
MAARTREECLRGVTSRGPKLSAPLLVRSGRERELNNASAGNGEADESVGIGN